MVQWSKEYSNFVPWPKIYRKSATCVVTEKIDGTNACIIINDDKIIAAQSRKRLITPESDNHGFAAWIEENEESLTAGLGNGYHYGEWAGPGINKNRHNLNEKRLYLFNTRRWGDHNPNTPSVCDVVPVLFEGPGDELNLTEIMEDLYYNRKKIGYIPEGVIVFRVSDNNMIKYTYETPKGKWRG